MTPIPRIPSGVANLDVLLGGGLPKGAVVVVAGAPGGGKTILAQQICFHNASEGTRVLYFSTLSEPVAKTLRYLSQFSFFSHDKLDKGVEFVDLGALVRSRTLDEAATLILDHVAKQKPAIVVIDSFKVFDDFAKSNEDLRKFAYSLAVSLMAWEATTLLLGEYGPEDLATNPLFSIVDSVVLMSQREQSGEQQRFIQISKMRGAAHSLDEHTFLIDGNGVNVFAPRVTIERKDRGAAEAPCKTGIAKLDELLGQGIPRGSSVLVSGVAGTGKTVLLLEFIYRGALQGEKGILFSFEETEERLRSAAHGLGFDLDAQIARGMVELVFIAQPSIMVEKHLLMMRERLVKMDARRVAVDSVSVFLHKVREPQTSREKVFQLATIVQNAGAVGLFSTDVPYGSNQISRFGVEETVVDGIFVLSSTQEGLERQRYLEVYKLRGTAHMKGRHNMLIERGGITVFPRYAESGVREAPPSLDPARRLPFGVPTLDPLLGGGLLDRSVTLISGSTGIGKSTLGVQFIVEGVRRKEPGLYVALEEGPLQIMKTAEGLGLPLKEGIDAGLAEIVFLSREHRAHELLAILSDRIQKQGTRRLVLDSVSQIADDLPPDELRQLLTALTARFKSLGVTSLLTLEARSLCSLDEVTDRAFSPVVDNVIVLRYTPIEEELRPTLMVVKTRSSAHDWGRHHFTVARGGVRIAGREDESKPRAARASAKKRARRR
jgi:circadian clock protein KaiC